MRNGGDNIPKREKYNYNQYHKEIDGVFYKKCALHYLYFPEDNDWFPCNKEYFYANNKNTVDMLSPYCKECNKLKARKYQKENPEIYREISRTNHRENKFNVREMKRKNNKDRRDNGKWYEYLKKTGKGLIYGKTRQLKQHTITREEWEKCLYYFGNSCAYCGMTTEEHKSIFKQQLHKEHVIHNGTNDLSNCIPSCKICNSYKWEFLIDEWYNKDNPKYTNERYEKIIKWLKEDYMSTDA